MEALPQYGILQLCGQTIFPVIENFKFWEISDIVQFCLTKSGSTAEPILRVA